MTTKATARKTFIESTTNTLFNQCPIFCQLTDLQLIYFSSMHKALMYLTELSNLLDIIKNEHNNEHQHKETCEIIYETLMTIVNQLTKLFDKKSGQHSNSNNVIYVEKKLTENAIDTLLQALSSFDTEFTHNLQCNLQQLRKFINYETGTAS